MKQKERPGAKRRAFLRQKSRKLDTGENKPKPQGQWDADLPDQI